MKVFESTRGNPSRDLPEWLEEFKEKLVDDNVPERRDAPSSSHELSSEPRAKVVSGECQHQGAHSQALLVIQIRTLQDK